MPPALRVVLIAVGSIVFVAMGLLLVMWYGFLGRFFWDFAAYASQTERGPYPGWPVRWEAWAILFGGLGLMLLGAAWPRRAESALPKPPAAAPKDPTWIRLDAWRDYTADPKPRTPAPPPTSDRSSRTQT